MEKRLGLYYFTGTGNTLFIAKEIADVYAGSGYRCSLKDISKIKKDKIGPLEPTAGILFPVFGLSMPGIMKSFLKRLQKSGDTSCFIIANGHSNTGKTIKQAARILTSKGYSVLGTAAVHTPSSSIITEETEPEDEADIMRNEAGQKARSFASAMIRGESVTEQGNITFKDRMMSAFFKMAMPGAVIKKITVNDSCVSCGYCSNICPRKNITIENGKPKWGKECEVCLRCVNFCPNNAIQLMSSEGRKQYREPSFKPAQK